MGFVDSYVNHILHCAVYTGIGAYVVKSARASSLSSSFSVWDSIAFMVGGVAVATLGLYSELNYVYKRIGLPPGSPGYPLLGHLIEWMRNPRAFLGKQARKYGGFPFTTNFLMIPTVILSSDDDVRWATIQERKGNLKPTLPDHMKDLLGREVILFQSASVHRRLRRILEPSFTPSAIQAYLQTIDNITKVELEKWSARDDFCSSKDWAILTMRLFFVCAFGRVDENSLDTFNKFFTEWMDGFLSLIPFATIPGTRLYNAHQAGNKLLDLIRQMVDEFKLEHPLGSSGAETTMMGRLCYGVDDDGKTLTEEQLVQNIRIIVLAGHDTTKGSFSTFLYYLSEYPKLRELLVEEVKGFSEPLDMEELKGAPLLNAFLAETWRVVPPTEGHAMEVTSDFLKYKGYMFKRGVGVKTDITYDSVTNEERYLDAGEFRVERWLPKDHPLHDPKYFLEHVDYNVMSVKYRAFNVGAHMCLGVHFAKLEVRIVLTRLLQKYDIEVRNDKLNVFPLLQHTNDFKISKRIR